MPGQKSIYETFLVFPLPPLVSPVLAVVRPCDGGQQQVGVLHSTLLLIVHQPALSYKILKITQLFAILCSCDSLLGMQY